MLGVGAVGVREDVLMSVGGPHEAVRLEDGQRHVALSNHAVNGSSEVLSEGGQHGAAYQEGTGYPEYEVEKRNTSVSLPSTCLASV